MKAENDDDLKKDGTAIPKGWDNILFTLVKEGDAVVCAAPFAIPIKQKFTVKTVDEFDAMRRQIPDQAFLTKDGIRCKTGLRFKTIKTETELNEFQSAIQDQRKKVKCELKRREVGGNFAKMNCWGIIGDFIGGKNVACKGYNIYGDRVDGKDVGEIPAITFRDVIHENVGECKRLVTEKRIIVPHDILEKGRALLSYCNDTVLNMNDNGIPADKQGRPIKNPLAPDSFRSMERRNC